MDDFFKSNNSSNNSSNFSNETSDRPYSYYTENHSKNNKKRFGFGQLVVVAILSSVVGGMSVAMSMTAFSSVVQPMANSLLKKVAPEYAAAQNQVMQQTALPQAFKKVEIEKSDSPVSAIAEKVGPSIVGIRITVPSRGFSFFGEEIGGGGSEGSGIIISKDGYIMTNNHVIESAIQTNTSGKKMVNGAKIEVITSDKKTLQAKVIGTDPRTDLAVIKVDGKDLPAVELGNSDEVKVGELAVAIGNPGGLEFAGSVTVGVISGLNRTIDLENGSKMKLIQTDAAINPGNSGGALLNSRGQVIGINTLKMASPGFEGLGFAIPINHAKVIVDSLINNGYVTGRPQIGITTDGRYTEDLAKRRNWPVGVYVSEVSEGLSADRAGIKPGDVITKFDGQPVKNINELNEIKEKHKAGDTIEVEISRNGETMKLQLILSEDKGIR